MNSEQKLIPKEMSGLCIATTKAGKSCTNKAKINDFCGLHFKKSKKETKGTSECITITFGDVAENHVRMLVTKGAQRL